MKKMSKAASVTAFIALGAVSTTLISVPSVQAQTRQIAVFGDNNADNFINSLSGFSATLVTDAQLATSGFLDSFDAFYYTRDGFSFGTGLSAAAASNVANYVGSTGDIVLFFGDFDDALPGAEAVDPGIDQIITNALNFVSASGRGFIGEFDGAVSALTSNSNGFNPIGLVNGSAGPLGFDGGGSTSDLVLTSAGIGNPVVSGVSFPFNPVGVDFGASASGIDPNLIVATWSSTGDPAIVVVDNGQAVPEPTSVLGLLAIGVLGTGSALKRKLK
jgi:hypothetical protein